MNNYEPVFLPNEAITAGKHKVGDTIRMKVMEVMDDGVKCMCSHGMGKSPMKEMGDRAVGRYKEAMGSENE